MYTLIMGQPYLGARTFSSFTYLTLTYLSHTDYFTNQRTLTVGGRIIVLLVSSFSGLDLTQQENIL